jgi:hypothetical protein
MAVKGRDPAQKLRIGEAVGKRRLVGLKRFL